jgi:molybdopterin/thiamine biosynthesis adenylyltransferase
MVADRSERYARQQLIEWWDQERLRDARVLVAGIGALGNEVIKNLALLGVGRLFLIDFDRVEYSNLSRTILFRESDVGRPKVEAAAEALVRINPDMAVQVIDGDLFYDVGLGEYRQSDLVIGCVDSLAARAQIGRSCGLVNIPYLDGGMWSLGGEARWFLAGDGPCFECTLNSYDRERANERRSCSGFRPDWEETERMPTTATTASIIGGLLAQEAIKWLCGYPTLAGKAIVYNGQALTLHRSELTRNPRCSFSHVPYQEIIELSEGPASLTPRQLLARGRAELERAGHLAPLTEVASEPGLFLALGRDFLLALQCPGCGRRQEINQHWNRVPERERICPFCGTTRRAEVIHTLDENSAYLDRPLSRLGVPGRGILAVHTLHKFLLYQIDK